MTSDRLGSSSPAPPCLFRRPPHSCSSTQSPHTLRQIPFSSNYNRSCFCSTRRSRGPPGRHGGRCWERPAGQVGEGGDPAAEPPRHLMFRLLPPRHPRPPAPPPRARHCRLRFSPPGGAAAAGGAEPRRGGGARTHVRVPRATGGRAVTSGCFPVTSAGSCAVAAAAILGDVTGRA